MSSPHPSLAYRAAPARHPVVLARRSRDRVVLIGAGVLVPLAAALALSIEMPKPGIGTAGEVLAALAGVVGVLALATSRRYAVTLTLLTLYLGLLDGPVKLLTSSRYFSGLRDVLIIAISAGMLARLRFKPGRVSLPPLSGWVLGFVALVVVEAFNPNTNGFLKSVGGYRQELEFMPLFFFGYAIMRSKQRFRQLFLVLGVIALANGVVGAIQYRLSPAALGRWGPGYTERVEGKHSRTYKAEGVSHSRPPALGSDAGFGGGIGAIALPGLIALLNTGTLRRRWPVLLCCGGALLGIATAASRSATLELGIVFVSYLALSLLMRLRVSRAISGLLVVLALGLGVAGALVAIEGGGIFKRQSSLGQVVNGLSSEASGAEGEEAEGGGDAKVQHLNQIPTVILHEPFGLGLGVAGSVSGLGGKEQKSVEEQKVSGGSAYNLLAVELGLPGLLLWVGFTVAVLALALTRLSRVRDTELRTYLMAVVATFLMLTVAGLAGPTLAVTPPGAYLWFAPGVIGYWLAGPGRGAMAERLGRTAGAMTARLAPST